MAKCVHCASRKGKRKCPALGGEICTACCGEHRRVTIACPDDCVWLGGGQLSLAPAPNATRSERLIALREKAQGYLLRHKSTLHAASDAYTFDGEVPVTGELMPGLIGFAMYGYRDEAGKRCIDRFRESEGRKLRTDELEVLGWLESAHFRLLEVSEVRLDEGFTARDLLRAEKIVVREKMATHELARFDVVATWMTRVEGVYELEGSSLFVPRDALEEILEDARDCLEAPEGHPHPIEQLVPAVVHSGLDAHLQDMAGSAPVLHNTDGDLLVLSEVRYAVRDAAQASRGLAELKELDKQGDGDFIWMDRDFNEQLKGPTMLGRVVVDGTRMCLQTNSRERLEEGREMLERSLGAAISHQADVFTDPMQAAQAAPGSAQPARLETPEAMAMIAGFMQSRIEAWIDEAVPALGGKTPRQAAADPATREQVIHLLKGYENLVRRQKPAPDVDFSILWRELGLSDS